MKRIILIKPCNKIQLAHVYEHLYLSALSDFLKKHKLLNYLDYRWHGQVHYGGFVYIYIGLVTPEAQKLEGELTSLNPNLSEEAIRGAIEEITAEKKKRMGGNGKLLSGALEALHAQPWQTIADFTYLDRHAVRQSRRVIWETDQVCRTKILKSELILDDNFLPQDRRLLPLFSVTAKTLEDNMTAGLVEEFAYYRCDEDSSVYNGKIAKEIVKYRITVDKSSRLENELEICKASILWALNQNFVGKLASFMQERRLPGEVLIGPDEVDVYEACGIFVGDKGWRHIATAKNIRRIMRHMTLQLTFGRETQQLRLAQILDDERVSL